MSSTVDVEIVQERGLSEGEDVAFDRAGNWMCCPNGKLHNCSIPRIRDSTSSIETARSRY